MRTNTDVTIKTAMSVARDVAEGRLDPAELDRAAADQCRGLFGVVAGPDDALWPLHVDVARQVLALGGIPANEQAEWLTVARQREQQSVGATDAPAEPVSSASAALSLDSGGAGDD